VSRSQPAGVEAVARSSNYRASLAVEIGFGTPLRYTDNQSGLTIDGDTYTFAPINVSAIPVDDGQSQVTVRVSNTGNIVSTADLASAAPGKTLVVYEVHFDSTGTQKTEVVLHSGRIVSVAWDTQAAEFTSTTLPATTGGQIGRIASRLCQYVFKGSRCGYAGATTSCDHLHATCTTLSNSARYGGFRLMPEIGSSISVHSVTARTAADRLGLLTDAPTPKPR
jgi:hypothetical protein